jgi:lysophospholipase L1-like esterase
MRRPPLTLARRLGLACAMAALVLAGSSAALAPAAAQTSAGPPPDSIASMGDSITRAFNACGFYVDCTRRSFSTGDDRSINSGAEYVTILIGANDACTGSEAAMTPVGEFRASIDQALGTLQAGLPDAKLLVISIPDIKRLWEVGRNNLLARTFWSIGNICQSMLANPTSTAADDVARRDRVRQRVIDYNTQLAAACAAYGPNCRYDGNVVFNFPFTLAQVSGWDYFHPNATGQRLLGEITYEAGYHW